MGESGKVMPNLDQKSTKLLNLTVLQRIDPCVEEILITAAHVTLYQFDIQLSQWSRKDVEGSLFVVKRNKQPRFQFIVMNRRNTENLVENLLGDFEFEIQVPYLLYRNAAQQVNGIWFYNARDCDEVASLFGRILNAYSKLPTISSSKSEFEELEAVPTVAVMDGPLEPLQSTTTNATKAPDDHAFVNFFSSAMNIGNSSIPTLTEIQTPCATTALPTRPVNMPPMLPSPQIASTANFTSASLLSLLDTSDSNNNSDYVKRLVKPSSFSSLTPSTYPLMAEPGSSSVPTAPSLNIQSPYGIQVLQPFPPSNSLPSSTPASAPTHNYGSVVSRDKVQEALLLLAQDNQFIDVVYQTLLNAHHS